MRKLGELRAFIENLPENKTFRFSLDGPFSWRGSYQEVGFCIVRRECSKKELLEVVNYAFTGIFEGYKGANTPMTKRRELILRTMIVATPPEDISTA